MSSPSSPAPAPAPTSTPTPQSPTFLSILGPPGSGKGTQCALLAQRFKHCVHLSIGDLLREEAQDPSSPYAEVLRENLRCGRLGAREMTCGILASRIERIRGVEFRDGGDGVENEKEVVVLLDGFPRQLETAEYFEQTVGPIHRFLVFQCPTSIIEQRLQARKRNDDDVDTIRKRIEIYELRTLKVLERYDEKGKVTKVDASEDVDAVARALGESLKGVGVVLEER
ncbi:P-loop containing nucleoside triphosphate hydrolase protein [Periconia macrospinosa]|uniref:P-loop containing nucleoside triphosphate hydrolase protein n=1 Tax=Periconia macrospinosa TaxID=97972 RepID=A0A2V1E6I4_9PLEO|nr:P-loop containing nucleoside triphosphate hydrolase protein [Periconia macrospinosa]